MMRRFRYALVPTAILAVALGIVVDTSSASSAVTETAASETPRNQTGQNTETEAERPRAQTGSGSNNVYSQESLQETPLTADAGQRLYVQGCASCHGLNGEGRELEGGILAPSLIGDGAAAVDFYVGTGRMPLDAPMKQAPRRDPVYTDAQVKALAAYVDEEFGGGPPIPTVNPERGDLVEGNLIYANNCAACHHSSGSGGAVGAEYYAPAVVNATPVHIAEAIRVGPGAMPIFNDGALTDQQVDSVVRYIEEQLKNGESPGGFNIGSLGPFSEGFFAWIVGLGAMLGVIRWIGTRE